MCVCRVHKLGVKSALPLTFVGLVWDIRGKHTPLGDEEFRRTHKVDADTPIDADEVLPAVTLRDPCTSIQKKNLELCVRSPRSTDIHAVSDTRLFWYLQ